MLGKPGDSLSGDSLFLCTSHFYSVAEGPSDGLLYVHVAICLYIIYKYLFTAGLFLIRSKHRVETECEKEKKKALTLPLSFALETHFSGWFQGLREISTSREQP